MDDKKMLVTLELTRGLHAINVQVIADSKEVVEAKVQGIIANGAWFNTDGKVYFCRGDDVGQVTVEPLPYWD